MSSSKPHANEKFHFMSINNKNSIKPFKFLCAMNVFCSIWNLPNKVVGSSGTACDSFPEWPYVYGCWIVSVMEAYDKGLLTVGLHVSVTEIMQSRSISWHDFCQVARDNMREIFIA